MNKRKEKLSSSKTLASSSSDNLDADILSDAEIEMILEAEGGIPPATKEKTEPFEMAKNESNQGRYALLGKIFLVIFAIVTIWQSVEPLIKH